MASSVPNLSALLRRATLDDHAELLRAADNALTKSNSDALAEHVKVVALLKLDRFDDALRVFQDAGEKLKEKASLEYAYALYKAGKLEEAERVASKAENRAMRHVLAQARYRLEKFKEASALYQELSSKNNAVDNDADLRINSLATAAQLEWAGSDYLSNNKWPSMGQLDAFETTYNAACVSIARGDLARAEVALKRARDLCNALDDLSDEDKLAETLPIMVQQLYVLIKQGRLEEAERLAAGLPLASISDLSTRLIAQVNKLVTDSKTDNPYLSHRLFHATPTIPESDRLFQYQKSTFLRNGYVVDLASLKYTGVVNSTSAHLTSGSDLTSPNVAPLSVLNAAGHAQSQTSRAAIKCLLTQLEKRPRDAGLLLTVIHIYLLTNNHGSAVALFESFFKRLEQSGSPEDLAVRFAPGVIAAAVALYGKQGRKAQVKQELAKAAKYWRNREKKSSDYSVPQELLRASGVALLEEQNRDAVEEAAEIFGSLAARDQADEAAKAGVIAANALLSPGSIKEDHISSLPPIRRLIPNLDILANELEASGVPTGALSTSAAAGNKRKAAVSRKDLSKRTKIRKSRLPKDYVEGKEMDKERWLPLRDRSSYRPKKKKGKGRADAGGLTQGGISVDDKGTGSGAESKPAAPGGGAGGGGHGKKKKGKGKGGKW